MWTPGRRCRTTFPALGDDEVWRRAGRGGVPAAAGAGGPVRHDRRRRRPDGAPAGQAAAQSRTADVAARRRVEHRGAAGGGRAGCRSPRPTGPSGTMVVRDGLPRPAARGHRGGAGAAPRRRWHRPGAGAAHGRQRRSVRPAGLPPPPGRTWASPGRTPPNWWRSRRRTPSDGCRSRGCPPGAACGQRRPRASPLSWSATNAAIQASGEFQLMVSSLVDHESMSSM